MALYNLIMSLILMGLKLRFLVTQHTRTDLPSFAERLYPPIPRAGNMPLIWVHGASNGELTAARSLLKELLERAPSYELVVTTNSLTAREMVNNWSLPRTNVRLAPVDQRSLTAAFLDNLRPSALVILENELWPNRLLLCAASGIPVLVLGARMSEKSAKLWQRYSGLGRKLMATINWLAPQDDASRERFVSLGFAQDRLGPTITLKSTVEMTRQASDLPFEHEKTILAASTHEHEEEIVLDAFVELIANGDPAVHLILAPRHPRRRDEIEAMIARRGLTFTTRSRNQVPEAFTQVYLADTMGEMPLWYGAAAITFVGGSLTDRGGHTPYEPAAYGSAIIHGPDVANFSAAYAVLTNAGAAEEISDAVTLRLAFSELLLDSTRRQEMARKAAHVLTPNSGESDLATFFGALEYLTSLKLNRSHPTVVR